MNYTTDKFTDCPTGELIDYPINYPVSPLIFPFTIPWIVPLIYKPIIHIQ